MTPIERIQSAIDKLTAERDASTSGAWSGYQNILGVDRIRDERGYIVAECYGDGDKGADNAELIVTLQRTIDAQLAILNDGLIVAKHWEDILDKVSGTMRTPITHALLIADAILGAVS